jgi:uncharacterized membrane protein YfcA
LVFLVSLIIGFWALEGFNHSCSIIFANLPMKQAVGTSLFIIFINSHIGFIGDLLGVCQTGPQSSINYYSNGNARTNYGTKLSKE